MPKIFIVVNVDWFFLSHRLPIALAAKKIGYDVTIITADTGKKIEIEGYGLKTINLPMSRSGINPFRELYVIYFLCKLYLKEKPDITHHVGMKLILYGSFVNFFTKIKTVNAVSGLGSFFAGDRKNTKLFSAFILQTLKFVLKCKHFYYIFQNEADRQSLQYQLGISNANTILIKGSGVDITQFKYVSEPTKIPLKVVLVARMLKDKGVVEFVEAARKLESKYKGKVEFILVGGIDNDNPTGLNKSDLYNFVDGKYIRWIGHQEDIRTILSNSNLVVLPSYREGLPKSLIEACAIGRAIVTTNTPGCYDVVSDGDNGFLVPVRSISILADRIETLLDSNDLRTKMGKAGRKKAEDVFSLDIIVNQTLEVYHQILT